MLNLVPQVNGTYKGQIGNTKITVVPPNATPEELEMRKKEFWRVWYECYLGSVASKTR